MLLINGSDLSQIANNIQYTDSFNNGASTLTFEYPTEKAGLFENGSTVVFVYGGAKVFYGFLFCSSAGEQVIRCTAYDQLRYLKSQAFVIREVETLDQFCNKVFFQVGDRIRIGTIEPTVLALGKHLFNNQSCLDMIYGSIRETCEANGYLYALRDEFGALCLRDVYGLRLPLVIGDRSLATGYSYSRSIDDDTANHIVVGRDNGKEGLRNLVSAEDSASIARWGKLMLCKAVEGEKNEAQMRELAANLLAEKNRETQTLSIDCIGDLRVRAGCGVKVTISAVGLDLWALVTRAAHSFEGASHTMKLELEYGRWRAWTL